MQILDALHAAEPEVDGAHTSEFLSILAEAELGPLVAHAATLLLRDDPDRFWPPTADALRRLLPRRPWTPGPGGDRSGNANSTEFGTALAWVARDLPADEALIDKFLALLFGELSTTSDRGSWLQAAILQIRDSDPEAVWSEFLRTSASPTLKYVEVRNSVALLTRRTFSAEKTVMVLEAVARGMDGADAGLIDQICNLVRGWNSADPAAREGFLRTVRGEPVPVPNTEDR